MRSYDHGFQIGGRNIARGCATYFIADIGANHDGSLERAKDLIKRAAESGAHCAKFQHFKAETIVSDAGFRDLKVAHQAGWEKSVYETYEDYSINRDWTVELAECCKDAGIDFMTTPYDLAAIHQVDPYVKAFKIGSGDITYLPLITEVASMKKPIFLATGASTMGEVDRAVHAVLRQNRQLCLMQCNTNYTGDKKNFKYVNLLVLESYAEKWPGMPLGLSDHTQGHVTALGAIALGACVIEKHFTDDETRKGPDHAFALNPSWWEFMIRKAKEIEDAVGDGIKLIEENEVQSRVVQRRALRMRYGDRKGAIVKVDEIDALRPCPDGAFTPMDINEVVGRVLKRDKEQGQEIYPDDLE